MSSATPIGRPSFFARLFSGTAWVLAGRAISAAALIGVTAITTRRLPTDAQGAYLFLLPVMPWLTVLANFCTTEILLRDLRQRLVRHNLDGARLAFLSCAKVTLVGSATVALGLYVISSLGVIKNPAWLALQGELKWVALWILLQALAQAVGDAARGLGKFGLATAVFLRSGGWAVNLVLLSLLGLLWRFDACDSLRAVLMAQAAAIALPLAWGVVSVIRALGDPATLHEFDAPADADRAEELVKPRPTVRWLVGESWPLFASSAIAQGIEQLDSFVVMLVCTSADVADYGLAKQLIATINFAFASITQAITPFVAELYQKNEIQKLGRLLRGIATLIAVPTMLICLALFLFAEFFVSAVGSPERLGATATLRVQIIGQMVLLLAGHSYLALSMTGRQRSLMHCTFVVGLVYLLLGPAATMAWGTVGAGAARSVGLIVRAILASWLVHHHLGIWTMASLSPASLRETLGIILGKGRGMLARKRS